MQPSRGLTADTIADAVPAGLAAELRERGAAVVRSWREGPRLYLFAEAAGGLVFARSSADPADRAVLAHEAAVRALVGSDGPLSVPAILAAGDDWLLEEALAGSRWDGTTPVSELVRAAEQISELSLPPSRPHEGGSLRLRRGALERRLRQLARPGLLADARRARRILTGAELPEATSHGDFHPDNVFFGPGRVWVIDWELSGRRSRGYDLMQFRANLAAADERLELFEAAVAAIGEPHRAALARLGYALLVRTIVDRLTSPFAFNRDPLGARALLATLPGERRAAGF